MVIISFVVNATGQSPGISKDAANVLHSATTLPHHNYFFVKKFLHGRCGRNYFSILTNEIFKSLLRIKTIFKRFDGIIICKFSHYKNKIELHLPRLDLPGVTQGSVNEKNHIRSWGKAQLHENCSHSFRVSEV